MEFNALKLKIPIPLLQSRGQRRRQPPRSGGGGVRSDGVPGAKPPEKSLGPRPFELWETPFLKKRYALFWLKTTDEITYAYVKP